MRQSLVFTLAILSSAFCHAQEPQPLPTASAGQMMAQAETQAAAEHKNILVLFTASWCGPCHMLDGFFNDKKVAPVVDQGLVIVHLDVGERKSDAHHANTPGGERWMSTLGGEKAGFPFYAMVDTNGKLIVNSMRDGSTKENIGYPQTAPQIDWFLHMMQTALPAINKKQFNTVREGILDQSNHPTRFRSVEYTDR